MACITRREILAVALLTFVIASLVQASTPPVIKVQGNLTQNDAPVNGLVTMVFALYDAQAPGGAMVDSAGPYSVTVENGIYEVEVAFGAEDFAGVDRYMQISVNGEVMTPRMRIVSVPYAYQTDRLDGLEATAFVRRGGDTMAGPLAVQGEVYSIAGGFRFPDGTLQTTARVFGVAGPAGSQGPTGLQGQTGPVGFQGSTGDQGPVGLQGPTGAGGPVGPVGPEGPPGPGTTFTQCKNFSGGSCTTTFCSCGSAQLVVRVQSDCTVTSAAGSCTALSFSCTGGGIGHGTCCVCKPS